MLQFGKLYAKIDVASRIRIVKMGYNNTKNKMENEMLQIEKSGDNGM